MRGQQGASAVRSVHDQQGGGSGYRQTDEQVDIQTVSC